MTRHVVYTDHEISAIAGWLKEGLSAAQIAARMAKECNRHATRSAVCGLVFRNKTLKEIGLRGRRNYAAEVALRRQAKPPAPKKPKKENLSPAARISLPARQFLAAKFDFDPLNNAPVMFREKIHRPRAEVLEDHKTYDQGGLHVPLTAIGAGCRWPVNEPKVIKVGPREILAPGEEHLFCGRPREKDRSWCHHHRMRSIQCR